MNEYGEALRLLEAQLTEMRYQRRMPSTSKVTVIMADVPENRRLVRTAQSLVAFQNVDFEFVAVDLDD